MRRHHSLQPPLITTAPESNDDEYDRRRKRYAIMMALRALCVIGAAVTYRVSMILALAFVAAGLVLPWCAVLIANDRPPKKRQRHTAYPSGSGERALPAGSDERVVDGGDLSR
jgi:Flp pilus assembly protein TadB